MKKPNEINVLIACEESQRTCMAFRELGFNAFSCDIQECSGEHPEWHILGDVLPILNGNCRITTQDGCNKIIAEKWNLIIAHPPCTYLTTAGARWLYADGKIDSERYEKGQDAKRFFSAFLNADCKHIAIENPTPMKIFDLPKHSQIIQPYEYGHPYSKKTCLWLKNLPELIPSNIIENHVPFISSGSYTRTHDPKYKGASRKGGSSVSRSKTFQGIANAFAEQWGRYLMEELT